MAVPEQGVLQLQRVFQDEGVPAAVALENAFKLARGDVETIQLPEMSDFRRDALYRKLKHILPGLSSFSPLSFGLPNLFATEEQAVQEERAAPPAVSAELEAAVNAVADERELRSRLAAGGGAEEPPGGGGGGGARRIFEEIHKRRRVLQGGRVDVGTDWQAKAEAAAQVLQSVSAELGEKRHRLEVLEREHPMLMQSQRELALTKTALGDELKAVKAAQALMTKQLKELQTKGAQYSKEAESTRDALKAEKAAAAALQKQIQEQLTLVGRLQTTVKTHYERANLAEDRLRQLSEQMSAEGGQAAYNLEALKAAQAENKRLRELGEKLQREYGPRIAEADRQIQGLIEAGEGARQEAVALERERDDLKRQVQQVNDELTASKRDLERRARSAGATEVTIAALHAEYDQTIRGLKERLMTQGDLMRQEYEARTESQTQRYQADIRQYEEQLVGQAEHFKREVQNVVAQGRAEIQQREGRIQGLEGAAGALRAQLHEAQQRLNDALSQPQIGVADLSERLRVAEQRIIEYQRTLEHTGTFNEQYTNRLKGEIANLRQQLVQAKASGHRTFNLVDRELLQMAYTGAYTMMTTLGGRLAEKIREVSASMSVLAGAIGAAASDATTGAKTAFADAQLRLLHLQAQLLTPEARSAAAKLAAGIAAAAGSAVLAKAFSSLINGIGGKVKGAMAGPKKPRGRPRTRKEPQPRVKTPKKKRRMPAKSPSIKKPRSRSTTATRVKVRKPAKKPLLKPVEEVIREAEALLKETARGGGHRGRGRPKGSKNKSKSPGRPKGKSKSRSRSKGPKTAGKKRARSATPRSKSRSTNKVVSQVKKRFGFHKKVRSSKSPRRPIKGKMPRKKGTKAGNGVGKKKRMGGKACGTCHRCRCVCKVTRLSKSAVKVETVKCG